MRTTSLTTLLVTLACSLACPKERAGDTAAATPMETPTTGGEAPASQPANAPQPFAVNLPAAGTLPMASESDAAEVREKLTGSWVSTTEGPNGMVISQTLSFVGDGAFTEVNAAGEQRRESKGTYRVTHGDDEAFQLELKTARAIGGGKVVYSLRSDGTLVAQGGGREFVYQRMQAE